MPDTKRVLVLQHIVENPAGRVGIILDEYGIPYHLLHVGKDHLPDPTRYQAIVALGGTQHVYDRHRYPYTVHEETYLHQAIKQGIPYPLPRHVPGRSTPCVCVSSDGEEASKSPHWIFTGTVY